MSSGQETRKSRMHCLMEIAEISHAELKAVIVIWRLISDHECETEISSSVWCRRSPWKTGEKSLRPKYSLDDTAKGPWNAFPGQDRLTSAVHNSLCCIIISVPNKDRQFITNAECHHTNGIAMNFVITTEGNRYFAYK